MKQKKLISGRKSFKRDGIMKKKRKIKEMNPTRLFSLKKAQKDMKDGQIAWLH